MRWHASQSRHVLVTGFVQQSKRLLTWRRGLSVGVNVAELSLEFDLDAREQTAVVTLSVAENTAASLILHRNRNFAPSAMR